jgi:hypothetical protein
MVRVITEFAQPRNFMRVLEASFNIGKFQKNVELYYIKVLLVL